MSYTAKFSETVRTIFGDRYRVIHLSITIENEKMPINSGIEFVHVSNGTTVITPFVIAFSLDRKGVSALFTTDAFTGISGSCEISFGFENQFTEVISGFDPSMDIGSLQPIFSSEPYQDATNFWLSNL
jgi:hypothetical protein